MNRSNWQISEYDLQRYVDGRLCKLRKAYVISYLYAHPVVAARIEDLICQRQMVRDAFLRTNCSQTPNDLQLVD